MGNRRIILELDREPQDLQAVWRLDSIARLIQQALVRPAIQKAEKAIFFEMNRSTLGGAIDAWTVVWERLRSSINNYYK